MKIGDLVNVKGSFGGKLYGTLLKKWKVDNWWCVMTYDGVFTWPESQLEVLGLTSSMDNNDD